MSLLSIRSILKFLDLPWTKEMKHFLLTHTSRDKPRLVKNTVGYRVQFTVYTGYSTVTGTRYQDALNHRSQ